MHATIFTFDYVGYIVMAKFTRQKNMKIRYENLTATKQKMKTKQIPYTKTGANNRARARCVYANDLNVLTFQLSNVCMCVRCEYIQ